MQRNASNMQRNFFPDFCNFSLCKKRSRTDPGAPVASFPTLSRHKSLQVVTPRLANCNKTFFNVPLQFSEKIAPLVHRHIRGSSWHTTLPNPNNAKIEAGSSQPQSRALGGSKRWTTKISSVSKQRQYVKPQSTVHYSSLRCASVFSVFTTMFHNSSCSSCTHLLSSSAKRSLKSVLSVFPLKQLGKLLQGNKNGTMGLSN